jgi:TfoX/Sxy family transcriptional regulator of competence genes
MRWKKAPESLVALFDQVAPRDAPAERRKMFGYPAVFVNGNMFAGLHEERLVMRLPDEARTEFLALPGAVPFEPMPGRPMKEYVVAPAAMLGDPGALRSWLHRSLRYAVSLPPKEPKPKNAKAR